MIEFICGTAFGDFSEKWAYESLKLILDTAFIVVPFLSVKRKLSAQNSFCDATTIIPHIPSVIIVSDERKDYMEIQKHISVIRCVMDRLEVWEQCSDVVVYPTLEGEDQVLPKEILKRDDKMSDKDFICILNRENILSLPMKLAVGQMPDEFKSRNPKRGKVIQLCSNQLTDWIHQYF